MNADSNIFEILYFILSCSLNTYFNRFLADHTNGHTYATVLHPSLSASLSVTYVLWLDSASYRKTV